MKSAKRILSCLLLLLAATGSLQAKEGFGIMKKLVTLRRINPPEVLIVGTRIQAVGKASDREEQEIATRITTQLESELVQHDTRFSIDPKRPQTIIEVTVLNNSYETKWENRRVLRSKPAGKDSKGKTQYRQVEEIVRYQVVSHNFGASYKVQDLGTRKTLFADSLNLSYNEDFQEGRDAPTAADQVNRAVQRTVGQIVYNLTPTEEVLQVLVPKGSFEDYINLAEAGLWSRYSEAIEARPALSNPRDESYRQYALGVAFEALGYGADSSETTLRYLEQAAQHYNQALSLNPKEDFFSKDYGGSILSSIGRSSLNAVRTASGQEPVDTRRRGADSPLERVQTAMRKYQTLLSQNAVLGGKADATAGAKTLAPDAGAPRGSVSGMTNAEVVAMIKNGVPEEVVLGAIDQAENCRFDVSPSGLIELAKAKVGKAVLKQLQAKTCN